MTKLEAYDVVRQSVFDATARTLETQSKYINQQLYWDITVNVLPAHPPISIRNHPLTFMWSYFTR